MTFPNPADPRKETAIWTVVAAIAGAMIAWFTLGQFLLKPLETEIAVLNRRLDDSLQQSVLWHAELRSGINSEILSVAKASEERRSYLQERLSDQARRLDNLEKDINRIEQKCCASDRATYGGAR